MAKEVNDKEKKVKKESTKKETTKKASNKKDAGKKENKAGFFKEFKAELKRVSWPTLKQVVNNTFAVIAIVLIICVTVFILDVIFESLNTYGVEKLKALVTSSSSETVDVETVEGENNEVSSEAETEKDAQTETTVENVAADTTNEEATNTVENSVGNN